jgi:Coenzyme PQQ synthesis protein D (PqqD)
MKDARPMPNPLLAWREIENSVVIISPEDSVVHELNDTASFIWKQFNGKDTLEKIAARLVEEYEIDTETALADIERLATALGEKGLLQGYSQVAQGAARD